jgi:hypothetical protein
MTVPSDAPEGPYSYSFQEVNPMCPPCFSTIATKTVEVVGYWHLQYFNLVQQVSNELYSVNIPATDAWAQYKLANDSANRQDWHDAYLHLLVAHQLLSTDLQDAATQYWIKATIGVVGSLGAIAVLFVYAVLRRRKNLARLRGRR